MANTLETELNPMDHIKFYFERSGYMKSILYFAYFSTKSAKKASILANLINAEVWDEIELFIEALSI